jgi:hypothetical protein
MHVGPRACASGASLTPIITHGIRLTSFVLAVDYRGIWRCSFEWKCYAVRLEMVGTMMFTIAILSRTESEVNDDSDLC